MNPWLVLAIIAAVFAVVVSLRSMRADRELRNQAGVKTGPETDWKPTQPSGEDGHVTTQDSGGGTVPQHPK
jgi:hypothetical protein